MLHTLYSELLTEYSAANSATTRKLSQVPRMFIQKYGRGVYFSFI